MLTLHATGESASESEYKTLRHELLSNSDIKNLLPNWLKTHRDLGSFWGFIQPKFATYADRRKFIAEESSEVLNILEFGHSVEAEEQQK